METNTLKNIIVLNTLGMNKQVHKKSNKLSLGFTLIELLIVIAIVAILASLAIPTYNQYSNKAKFSEVISATQPYKLGIEIAVQIYSSGSDDLDSGFSEIPSNIDSSNTKYQYVDSISVVDGVITATSRSILLTNPTYILTATIDNQTNEVFWSVDASSTCLDSNLC